MDAKGQPRPDLAARLTAGALETEPIEARKWTAQASWKKAIRRMADALPKEEKPQAVAAFRVRKAVETVGGVGNPPWKGGYRGAWGFNPRRRWAKRQAKAPNGAVSAWG